MLILPGDPLFDDTLATPPPDWKIKSQLMGEPINFIFDTQLNIFRSASLKELEEYLYGGEYDELVGGEEDELD